MTEPVFIYPDWPAPANVHAASTTRQGGVSLPPYRAFNLASHVGDEEQAVQQNRRQLREALQLPTEPVWLEQVHGIDVIEARGLNNTADASITTETGAVCTVMTADCLPVLICDRNGRGVAAAHAGWRGLAGGIIEATAKRLCQQLDCQPDELMVWLGPAIGPQAFEVGNDVRDSFINIDADAERAFVANRPEHWMADIYQLARQALQRIGVDAIYGGEWCTYNEEGSFFSFRREPTTGRMASLIWLSE
ncbi:MAG: peptidoglycan editing factor PgeF [Gammaproteobacteria bacterium]|nr:peptidoglycan editing factor PgeF [Gammaproteobacteria bacterium]